MSVKAGQAHEIMRCLKRYVAREVYAALQHDRSLFLLDKQ
jgi:hypothetical protein